MYQNFVFIEYRISENFVVTLKGIAHYFDAGMVQDCRLQYRVFQKKIDIILRQSDFVISRLNCPNRATMHKKSQNFIFNVWCISFREQKVSTINFNWYFTVKRRCVCWSILGYNRTRLCHVLLNQICLVLKSHRQQCKFGHKKCKDKGCL